MMGGQLMIARVFQVALLVLAARIGWTAVSAHFGKVYGKGSPRAIMIVGYAAAAILVGLALALPYFFA